MTRRRECPRHGWVAIDSTGACQRCEREVERADLDASGLWDEQDSVVERDMNLPRDLPER